MYFHEGKEQPRRLLSGGRCFCTSGHAEACPSEPLRFCDHLSDAKRIQRKYAMRGNPFAREDANPLERVCDSFAAEAENAFRQFVLRSEFPCVGAKAAFNSSSYVLRTYGDLGCRGSTAELSAALCDFTQSGVWASSEYATFIAIFERPQETDELQFENLFWQQLRRLHELDAAHFDWDPNVRSDPADPHFSFSFGGQALYVIGLHANSSREARRFPWPALVFNPHEQFERLRADGKWKRMQETIRERDRELQGTINPMLSDFGEESEARQYSGRAVEKDWRAPFKAVERKCPFAH
jgi:FPC/CPF motif-containing protein YcgG